MAGTLAGSTKSLPHTACGLAVQLASQAAGGRAAASAALAGALLRDKLRDKLRASAALAGKAGREVMVSGSVKGMRHDAVPAFYALDCHREEHL